MEGEAQTAEDTTLVDLAPVAPEGIIEEIPVEETTAPSPSNNVDEVLPSNPGLSQGGVDSLLDGAVVSEGEATTTATTTDRHRDV